MLCMNGIKMEDVNLKALISPARWSKKQQDKVPKQGVKNLYKFVR